MSMWYGVILSLLETLIYSSKKVTDGGASFSDTPINLSNNTRSSSTPEIGTVASSVSGSSSSNNINIYVVWADKTTTTGIDDIYFTRSEDGGATFRPSINLSNNPLGFSLEPKVARCCIWKQAAMSMWYGLINLLEMETYTLKQVTDGGATFSSDRLSNNAGRSFSPQIAATVSASSSSNNNNVYVVWADETTTTGKADIYFVRSTNSGANFFSSDIKNLSNNLGGSSRPPPQPQIAVSENNVYVVWHDTSIASTPSVPAKDDIFLTKST